PGIVGLRLFPNPAFDEAAAKKWDAERYYTDEKYYLDKSLVRPYRVGMSCGFCHVGPNPVKPPDDPEHPKWENLSSNVGAQYFWIDRIFDWKADESTYIHQMFQTSRPGSLDTSLISTDNINNPGTMNAIYALRPRLDQAKRFGKETLGGGSLNNRQFNDYVPPDSPLAQFFTSPATVYSPRVLKDAADSVGALGALNRVYLNIGLFSEEWLLHFNPLIGGREGKPITSARGRRKLHVLGGHGGPDARHGALLPADDGAAQAQGRAGRHEILQRREAGRSPIRRDRHKGEGGLRGDLRPVPLQQAAHPGSRPRSGWLRRQGLSRLLEQVLGVDEDRGLQVQDARDRAGAGLPREPLPLSTPP